MELENNINNLKAKIKKAFEDAKNIKIPEGLSAEKLQEQIPKIQDKILDQLSLDLANAIDAFVKSDEVVNKIISSLKDKASITVQGKTGTSEPASHFHSIDLQGEINIKPTPGNDDQGH